MSARHPKKLLEGLQKPIRILKCFLAIGGLIWEDDMGQNQTLDNWGVSEYYSRVVQGHGDHVLDEKSGPETKGEQKHMSHYCKTWSATKWVETSKVEIMVANGSCQ